MEDFVWYFSSRLSAVFGFLSAQSSIHNLFHFDRSLDARDQFAPINWLTEKIIGPGLDAFDTIFRLP